MVEWHGRIVRDSAVMLGKPAITGTRLTVELLLDLLASGETVEGLVEQYPQLTRDDVLAALAYASEALKTDEAIVIA